MQRSVLFALIAFAVAAVAILVWRRPEPRPAGTVAVPAAPAEPRITQFYAAPPVLEAGGRASLCYGVESAGEVRLDPPAAVLSLSPNRCVEVAPARTTTYKLIARSDSGREAVATTTITVLRTAAPKQAPRAEEPSKKTVIEFFRAQPAEIHAGQTTTFCYAAGNATSVRIDPPVVDFALPTRGCFGYAPKATATYTLSASGPGGPASASVVVSVH